MIAYSGDKVYLNLFVVVVVYMWYCGNEVVILWSFAVLGVIKYNSSCYFIMVIKVYMVLLSSQSAVTWWLVKYVCSVILMWWLGTYDFIILWWYIWVIFWWWLSTSNFIILCYLSISYFILWWLSTYDSAIVVIIFDSVIVMVKYI